MIRALAVFLLAGGVAALAQSDFPAAANGSVRDNIYTNSFFRLRLELPKPAGNAILNEVRQDHEQQGRVLTVTYGGAERYTFGITILRRTNFPTLRSLTPFVRSVRHNFEREGQELVSAEAPVKMAGLDFVRTVLRDVKSQVPHLHEVECTELRGYIMCFELEAETEERLSELSNLNGKLTLNVPSP
ncbi:MAG: hypothetical protein HYX28_04380 [Candidatus Koribacter versatilis]|uniref:Uncharacterized protein n=1 Tax=Candidatus Korobacter versatilis TaxID=658062 RepID=A0A932A9B0_9BACT|nr:hypothetical protein [Candidatus Koribacter versatilis]